MQSGFWSLAPVYGAAILGGVLISAQGMINGRLFQFVGSPIQAALISFSIGWCVLLAILFATGQGLPSLSRMSAAPWWAFLGGFAGAFMVSSTAFGVSRIGSAAWIAILVASQMIAAITFDHFGAFGLQARAISIEKVGGILALGAGVWLIQR